MDEGRPYMYSTYFFKDGGGYVDPLLQMEEGTWIHCYRWRRVRGYIVIDGGGYVDPLLQMEEGTWIHCYRWRRVCRSIVTVPDLASRIRDVV
jgi:hypothetical protein